MADPEEAKTRGSKVKEYMEGKVFFNVRKQEGENDGEDYYWPSC
jgi:hypothetical protein